jgi:hypothetical protein
VLTELQQQMLVAARGSDERRLVALPASGSDEGEVKAGGLRLYGRDALEALAGLQRHGLLTESGRMTFVLTVEGERLADELTGSGPAS